MFSKKIHENGCGAMWRYVALCGAMWRYPKRQKMPKTGKMTFFDVFQELHENVCGAMWRYVALCGAMWRYVALCGAIQNGKK